MLLTIGLPNAKKLLTPYAIPYSVSPLSRTTTLRYRLESKRTPLAMLLEVFWLKNTKMDGILLPFYLEQ